MIPSPIHAHVWIDFDGTITRQDVLDELIRRFAMDNSWKLVEQQWQEGLIGSRECLSRQLAVVRIGDAALDDFLAGITLDPGLLPLITLLDGHNVPVTVLSDGLDRFIAPLLKRAGLGQLTYRANSFERSNDRLTLRCPHLRSDCESAAAHCKCNSIALLADAGHDGIYIGDGRSDLCPARKIKCRFAKGVLAKNLEREGISFLPYEQLSEIASILAADWSVPRLPVNPPV